MTTVSNIAKKTCAAALTAVFAVVFAFPVLPAHAAVTLSSSPSTVVVKLGTVSEAALAGDRNILSIKKVFVGAASPVFSDVYELSTLYTPAELSSLYHVDYAQATQAVQESFTTANNPGFTSNSTDPTHQWGLVKAHFPDAWDIQKGSASVKVAIIDTGIDGTHQSLNAGQVASGYNFLTQTLIQASTDSDDNGHGTLVSGIIGATPNNFRGIAGADWNVTLIPLKALDSSGSGNSADVASAIVYAADHGANVINMSFGGIGFANDTTLSSAIAYAYSKNVVMVAAAGNDTKGSGKNLDISPEFPVCDNNGQGQIIGVAATDINDQKASFSDYGKTCVDVSAPGDHILSTISFDPSTGAPDPNAYAYAGGTSMSVPFVSAEAVLIKSQFPNATNAEIRDRIVKSADSIDVLNPTQCGGKSCAGLLGSGRINAYAALNPTLVPTIADGSLVSTGSGSQLYFVSAGVKEPVSNFVLQQRFSATPQVTVPTYELSMIQTGPYAMPTDGTFVKSESSPTVYQIAKGSKHPVTYQVFVERNVQPSQVNVATDAEVSSWITTTFLAPPEGTLVKTASNPTVYWVVDGLLHPINWNFYVQRGLQIFPIATVSSGDLSSFAQGNSYVI